MKDCCQRFWIFDIFVFTLEILILTWLSKAVITFIYVWHFRNFWAKLHPYPKNETTYFPLILVAPQILHFDFGDAPINEDETVSVQCTISKGDNPLNISWMINNKKIQSYPGIVINNMKRVSLLTIESVRASHAGNFSCVASNSAGSSIYSAELNINGSYLIL